MEIYPYIGLFHKTFRKCFEKRRHTSLISFIQNNLKTHTLLLKVYDQEHAELYAIEGYSSYVRSTLLKRSFSSITIIYKTILP